MSVKNESYIVIRDRVFGGIYFYDIYSLKRNREKGLYIDDEAGDVDEKMKVLIRKETLKFDTICSLFSYVVYNLVIPQFSSEEFKKGMEHIKEIIDEADIKKAPPSEKKVGKYRYKMSYKGVTNCTKEYIEDTPKRSASNE